MYWKKGILVIVLFLFAVTNSYVVFASSSVEPNIEMNTGFEVEGYVNPDLDAFASTLQLTLLTSDYDGRIDNYDVNEKGNIVVAYKTISVYKKICVYNSVGEFQYGYSLIDFGTIGVEWDGENVIVYSVRSDYLILLDRNAQILDKKKVLNTIENNTYSQKILSETKRTVGSERYQLSSSKIIKIDSDGNQTVIVDKRGSDFLFSALFILYFVILITEVTIVMVRYFQKNRAA